MNKNLYLLWAADSTSVFGSAIYSLTLTLLAINYSDSALAAGSVLFVSTIPYLFLGVIGGVVVDRVNRKKLMLVCDISRSLLVLSIPISQLFIEDLSITYIMMIGFLVTCFRAFFFPANQASVPMLIKDKTELTKVNAYINSTNNLSVVMGPSLGGIALIFTHNAPALLYVTGLTFFISALCVYFIDFPNSKEIIYQNEKKSILSDAYQGFKHIFKGDVVILIMMIAFAVQLIIGDGIIQLVFPNLLESLNFDKEQYFGYLLSIIALSASICSFIMANIKVKRPSLWIFSGYLLRGLCYLLFMLSLTYGWYFAVIAGVLLGITFALSGPTLTTILQQRTPDHSLGKVMAVRSTIGNITDSISYLFIGGLISLTGVASTLSTAALLTGITTFGLFLWWKYEKNRKSQEHQHIEKII
jgi:DHA3 family macrolide efflux protein-like MFS transporter